MKFKIFVLVALILTSMTSQAKTKKFCGKRDGTAGNALLVDKNNNQVIELSRQGEDSKLLDQTDELIGSKSGVKGEVGTQNGKRYCVIADLDESGEPLKIIKAYLQK